MTTYEITFTKSARKELKKLPPPVAKRLATAVMRLGNGPRTGNVRPMIGSSSWRLRVGDYRVVYDIHDKTLVILVIKVRHRRDAYRG